MTTTTTTPPRAMTGRVTYAALGVLSVGFLIGTLTWAFPISLDRALGYGLRTGDGYQRP